MARHKFGSVADYVIGAGEGNVAVLQSEASVTCYNAASGGTQYTDLLASDGVSVVADGVLTTSTAGAIPEFYGPEGVTEIYLDANEGAGPRRLTVATDIAATAASAASGLAAHEGEANPHATRFSDLAGQYVPSVADLLTQGPPFYIAHRGGGAQNPEHTMAAYENALAAGAPAIEVSAQLTADGQLVCFHDTTVTRMTGLTGAVGDYTYAALKNAIKVKAQSLLGDGWADQQIPLLRDVLDRLYGRVVIFLEAKTNPSVTPMQNLLTSRYLDGPRSIVWKAYYTATTFAWAKSAGYTTWGYVDAGTTDGELNTYDTNIDMWGVPHTMSDARITAVAARGKPVICWEVHRRADVTRLSALGVDGMMTSEYTYVRRSTPILTRDDFALKIKAPGNMGIVGYDPTYSLKFDSTGGGARIDRVATETVLLGALCPTAASGYTIGFEMKYDVLPAASLHADFVFAKPDDAVYRFQSSTNSTGGYFMALRGNGDMQLYSHAPNTASGTSLGAISTATPVAGAWMSFTIEVGTQYIRVTRTDTTPDVTFTVDNTAYRGGYMHLSQGSINVLAQQPHFRNVIVTAGSGV